MLSIFSFVSTLMDLFVYERPALAMGRGQIYVASTLLQLAACPNFSLL